MLTKLHYTVPEDLLQEAANQIPKQEWRFTINEPTGSFFYDAWRLKEEFKGTVWEKVYDSLPGQKGEARLINLAPATCYQAHADIDDRYHLNITGEECYLIDFDNTIMHKLSADGVWNDMDAGRLHSAGNFGRVTRTQLVVRKLLEITTLSNPLQVKLTSNNLSKEDARFMFDQTISSWLNYASKNKLISNFRFEDSAVFFDLEKSALEDLKIVLVTDFKLELV